MIALNNGQYIIGFDNGYQFGKTAQKEKKELGLSMLAYVKEILRQHFENIQQERMENSIDTWNGSRIWCIRRSFL